MAMQKIGYDGTYRDRARRTREHAGGGARASAPARASGSRRSDWQHRHGLHDARISRTSRDTTARPSPSRLAAQPPIERQDPFPARSRRHRLHPVRDVESRPSAKRRSSRPIICRRRRAIIVNGTVRADSARAGRLRARRHRPRGRRRVARLPDHAEGARRRLPDGSAASLDPLAAAAGDPARPPRSHQRGPRLLQRAAASSSPTRRSSRRRPARARRRCFRCSTSTTRRRS